jgi:hypothetical protein
MKEKISNEIIKHFQCKLLHPKTPAWDGDYIWNENEKKHIPNIKWICKECNEFYKEMTNDR